MHPTITQSPPTCQIVNISLPPRPSAQLPSPPSTRPIPNSKSSSLQNNIGFNMDSNLLGKFHNTNKLLDRFLPKPQSAPQNNYGEWTTNDRLLDQHRSPDHPQDRPEQSTLNVHNTDRPLDRLPFDRSTWLPRTTLTFLSKPFLHTALPSTFMETIAVIIAISNSCEPIVTGFTLKAKKSIFQAFWKDDCCPDFLLMK